MLLLAQALGHENSALQCGEVGRACMQATIPLNLMEQNLSARQGQYQFPFTFQLPAHIPPSFAYRYGELMCAPSLCASPPGL